MIIDGKALAQTVTSDIQNDLLKLSQKDISPRLVVVTFASYEGAWSAYVRQKILFGKKNGIDVELLKISDEQISEFESIMKLLNENPSVTGIIIQRPFPEILDQQKVRQAVIPSKDIDGFAPDSAFEPPVWLAVKEILNYLSKRENSSLQNFLRFLKVIVIGKGEAGGAPMIEGLHKLGVDATVIDSKTQNKDELLKNADVVISAVGKSGVVGAHNLKKGVILIGLGINRDTHGVLHADYEEDEIKDIASYYTPVPGGVGPVNVAFLFYNLLKAAQKT